MFSAMFVRSTLPKFRVYAFLLCCSFILGLLTGVYIALRYATLYSLMIFTAASVSVSSTCLVVQTAFDFALTTVILVSRRKYLYILAFADALAFGIVVTAVYLSFGSAYWLVSALLLFSKSVALISLFWFWCRNISNQSNTARRDYFIALCTSVLAAFFDYYHISPYLLRLFA